MLNVGVDIAKNIHFASFLASRNSMKTLLEEKFSFYNNYEGLKKLTEAIEYHRKDEEGVLIGLEGTGHYWITLYHHLNRLGLKVVLLNPYDVKQYRKIHKRGTKTDPTDATLIARLMTEKQLYPVNDQEIDFRLRSLARAYSTLCKDIARCKNRIHRVCDILFPELLVMFGSDEDGRPRIPKTVIALLKKYPTPVKVLKADEQRLTSIVRKSSRGRYDYSFVQSLRKRAENSFGITAGTDGYEFELQHHITQLEYLQEKRKEFEIKISMFSNEAAKRLETIGGIGRPTAIALAAEIANIKRFSNKKKITRYVGLNPTVIQSGKFKGKSKISKTGNSHVRRLLVRVAWQAIRQNPDLQVYAYRKAKEGKSKKWIKCAVANKLLHRAYAILTEDRDFIRR